MSRFRFDIALQNLKRTELQLAKEVAATATKYYVNSFKKQAWGGKSWKEVKRRTPGTPEYIYPKKRGLSRRRKPILVGRGALRREVNASAKKITTKNIQFAVRLKYGNVHNEGLPMKNGKRMPKRQFMGWNRELDGQIKKVINRHVMRNMRTS